MHPVSESMGRWISFLHRQFQVYINKELKEYNISAPEYLYLGSLLMAGDGMSQDELSKRLFIDKGAVARSLTSLEKKGYVIRQTDEKDKRVKRVFLTEKAKALESVFYDVLSGWSDLITANMDEESVNVTLKNLKKMSMDVLERAGNP